MGPVEVDGQFVTFVHKDLFPVQYQIFFSRSVYNLKSKGVFPLLSAIISSPLTIFGYPNFPWQIGAFSGKIHPNFHKFVCVWFFG